MGGAQRVDGWGEVSGFQSPSHAVEAGAWGVEGYKEGGGVDGGFRVRFHRVILLQPHLSSPPPPAAHAASTTTTCAVTSILGQKASSVTSC